MAKSSKPTLDRTRSGAMLLLAFSIAYGWFSLQIPALETGAASTGLTARSLPTFLTFAGIALASFLIVQGGSNVEPKASRQGSTGVDWPTVFAFLLLMSLFGWAIRPLGFVLATALFLFSGFWLMGERKFWTMACIAIVAALFMWGLLSLGLGVYLPPLPEGL